MGALVDGVWRDEEHWTHRSDGRFVRQDSRFRERITADGSSGFRAEPGRYHLFVSLACPWAHRTLIFRKIKGLEETIDVSIVHWHMGADGWTFELGRGATGDTLLESTHLRDIYTHASPTYTGRVTVPILWDRQRATIVNNESAEIIRMLNSEFDTWARADVDFYPEALRDEIDAVNAPIYDHVNNGVYKCGFARSQEAYDSAVTRLFATLDALDERLATQRYLCGNVITEADWRLFTTLVRFDVVYHTHFKCNVRRIVDYDRLWGYVRELYQVAGVAETVDMHHIRHHYYGSHETLNPARIVAAGPTLDFDAPHGRDAVGAR